MNAKQFALYEVFLALVGYMSYRDDSPGGLVIVGVAMALGVAGLVHGTLV